MSAKLDDAAVREALGDLAGWSLEAGKLHREYRFPDFVAAFGFISSVALVAESMNHHPEWSNVYGRVTVDLVTHEPEGLTDLDFTLAEHMSRCAE